MSARKKLAIVSGSAALLMFVGVATAYWTGHIGKLRRLHAVWTSFKPAYGSAASPSLPRPDVPVTKPTVRVSAPAQASASAPAEFEVELNRDGTFTVFYHQLPLVRTGFRFWHAKWKWAGPLSQAGGLQAGSAPFDLKVPTLNMEASGKITQPAPNVLAYDLTVNTRNQLTGIIGGGIEFALDVRSTLFGGKAATNPELLPGNTGWKWPLSEGREMSVRFEPGLPRVFFENNNKARVRAFLLGETVAAGVNKVRMTITLPEGTRRKPTIAEEFGPEQTNGWLRNAMPVGQAPLDLSPMNHTPGKHGFLKAVGDRLQFEDGTPARFWGIDVMAYALFSQDQAISRHAKRLAMLGFNLVRLHHHDTTAWVSPTVIDKHTRDSRELDAHGIDRIDFWIKCLKENGIYVWLDLHSYRQFREGDRSTNLGEIATFDDFFNDKRSQRQVKGYCQYDPVLQKLMEEFQQKYLSHVNRYTGVAYKDEPTIAFALITNENDITAHAGMLAMPRANHPQLNRLFNERTTAFAKKTGIHESQLRQAWSPGPPKMFLNDQEHEFFQTMIAGVRRTGSHALVAAGNMWGDCPLSSIPSLTTGDVIDAHAYDGPGFLKADPRYKGNIVDMIGIQQVEDRPLTVSEWNVVDGDRPAVDRFAAPLYVASIAALQGWDALMLYGYSQQTLKDDVGFAGVWDAFNDPGLLVTMPAAAMLYRNAHVAPARREYRLALSPEQLFGQPLSAVTATAARTLIEQSRFAIGIPAVPELDWLKPSTPHESAVSIDRPYESFLPSDAHSITSDTGELTRDWATGLQTINTPRTQAAQGMIGEREIRLADVSLQVKTKHASVAVTSLDEQPLKTSRQILITSVARVAKPKKAQGRGATQPETTVFSEPVQGTIRLTAGPGLEAVTLSASGKVAPLKEMTYDKGEYHIPLDKLGTHWCLLRVAQKQ